MSDDLLLGKTTVSDALSKAEPIGNLQGGKKTSAAQAGKAADDFEAMFLAQILSPMWAGIEANSKFGGGSAEDTYRGMLVNEYGKLLSQAGGLGIADQVKAELLKAQEKA